MPLTELAWPRLNRYRRTAGALCALLIVFGSAPVLRAQTIRDGLMMGRNSFCTGFMYSHESWDQYWEGSLKRVNGNIGTLTTQSVSWVGNYGVTDRLNVIAMTPYMWTNASQGTLRGMSGFQDVTVAAKYKLLDTALTDKGRLRTILLASAGTPMTDYVPDFQPMAIGLGASRYSGRLTLDFRAKAGWFITGSSAYTWRSNVTLDRPSYYTNGELFFGDQVEMSDVFDYTISAGYKKGGLQIPVSFSQQHTRGGGDIRRQDMPFISNRMNYSQVDAVVEYFLPQAKSFALRVNAAYNLDGRNVGQSTTIAAGFLYVFQF